MVMRLFVATMKQQLRNPGRIDASMFAYGSRVRFGLSHPSLSSVECACWKEPISDASLFSAVLKRNTYSPKLLSWNGGQGRS